MMSVELSTGSILKPGTPQVLFQTRLSVNTIIDQYAVTAEGDRFLMPAPIDDSRPTPITVILNWRPGSRNEK